MTSERKTRSQNRKNAVQPLAKRHDKPELQKQLGWLKNGNKPFDLTQARRCGAKSKRTGKPCKQPAMKNGKCRLHGGKSTGPKTPEGRHNSRVANWKHGYNTFEYKQGFKALKIGLKLIKDPFHSISPFELEYCEYWMNWSSGKLNSGEMTLYGLNRPTFNDDKC